MKTYRIHTLDRWTCLLGAMVAIALMVPAVAVSQSGAVNLGTAGNFVILAKSGISTTGTTAITGNIGISPAAASFITGFALVADASNTFSTSSSIIGKVYAADYTPPTPSYMTTAIGDMQIAYTDAAGRTTPDSINMGAGDITGKNITHGLYKWSTGLSIGAAGVTISGSATDVWIFQIAGNLTVANGAAVTLSGGALASNIFWQVAGQVTIGTTVAMKGNILCQTQIAMSTGATLNGKALAQTAVTLNANTITNVGSVSSALVDTLTFRVYMGIKMKDNLFLPGSGDTVRVVGSFNNWNTTDPTVRMASTGPTDSIYTLMRIVDTSSTSSDYDHNDTLFFKFYRTNRGGNYESISSNRVYALVNGHHSTPIYYFDNDSTVKPAVSVTFKVKMAIKMREGIFLPTSGDIVTVTGDFDGWNNTTDTLKINTADSVYSKTVPFITQATTIHYKFYKSVRGGLDWEGNQATTSTNREYLVPVGGGTPPTVWFNNDSVFVPTITVNLLWQTDMSAMITLGWFNPATDSVDVRGAFTGWGSQKMKSNFVNSNIWEFTSQNLIATVGSTQSYKYYVRYKDSATIASKFSGYVWTGNVNSTPNVNVEDGIAYEHPILLGDGNNGYTVINSVNQTPPRSWFSGINPFGLLASTDTVNVTLSVNMKPAMTYSNPFDIAKDTLYLIWQDQTWWAAQAKIQGLTNFKRNVKMTRRGTDTVWTANFKVIGKTHYGMMYTFQYRQAAGTNQDQGGGLGGQNLFNVRFIPKASGVWPKTYGAPTDTWQASAPLPHETAPFTTDVNDKIPNVPVVFNLYQNYPNPFNPTTNILYSLPQQSNVKLRVYNILGQMVMELFNGPQTAGNHAVAFDASRLASGVYFYRLEAGSFVNVKKMVLLK